MTQQGAIWPYLHPPGGTCQAPCTAFGQCHCGCGARPTEAIHTNPNLHRTKGDPFVFLAGHHARLFPRTNGHWSRHGVPVERIRPMLHWLHKRHGTWANVSTLLQTPASTLKGYVNNSKRRRVPPEAAKRIADLVLAHRQRGSIIDQWEEDPGIRIS